MRNLILLGPDKTDKRICQCGHPFGKHGRYGRCWHWLDVAKGIVCNCSEPRE